MTRSTCFAPVVAALIVAGAIAPAFAQSGRGRHKRVFAVPAPRKVTIDAKLNDWDLSGRIRIYVIRETSEMQSARFAIMYDDQALYLSAEVRDPSPMMNRHDPWVDGHKAWDADACQFRIVLDPAQGYPVNQSSFQPVDNDQMAHLTLWYYTDRKEPNLQMHFGMNYKLPKAGYAPHGVVPHGKFQAAYAKAKDGRGYTFEYRIPWATLEAKSPPKAGDLVASTVQFNWSRPDGLKTAGGAAWAYDVMSGPGFTFQSSACWGKIIFSKKGNLPRELVEEGAPPERPLPLTFAYELPADAEVTIALFDRDGMCVRNLVAQGARRAGPNIDRWDGLDDRGKPLPPGTYAWRGLYHQPLKTKFVLSVHNSGRPPYKTDDNRGGWGGDHGSPTDVCIAGDAVVMSWNACESGWGIIRTDLAGKKQWGSKHSATYLATDPGPPGRIFAAGDHGFEKGPGVKVFDLTDSRPLNFANKSPILAPPPGRSEFRIEAPRLRYRPSRTYGKNPDTVTGLAYHGGKVYAAFEHRDLIGVYDARQGTLLRTWAVPKPGRLAVRPDGSLAAVSDGWVVYVNDGVITPLTLANLDEPAGVAVAADGTLFVANRGKAQNVSVYSPKGRYLRGIGKPGGRPRVGRYDKRGMLEPAGIALDKRGRLWVAEALDGPKRISVWDTNTGKLLDEFFGGSAYSTFVWMDPQHPDEVYCHNTLWKIDLDKGTGYPYLTCWRPSAPNGCPVPYNELRVITAKNGRQYAWGNVHARGTVLFLRTGDVFKPLLMLFYSTDGHILSPWPTFPLMDDIQRYPNGRYAWVDANDDQILQHEEITRIKPDHGFFHWVDKDLSLWSGAGKVYRPLRIEPDGRPVYEFKKPEETNVRGNNGHGPIFVDPHDGSLYTNWPGHDPGWARWAARGKLLWGYRGTVRWHEAINLPPLKPGNLWGPTCPLGVAGEFTGFATYFGPIHVFTRDGLYVAMLLRDGRHGGLGPDVLACETFAAQLVRPKGMKRYFLLAGDQDGRITEILGLETVRRLRGGTYVLAKADVDKAAKASGDYAARKAKAQRLTVARGRGSLKSARSVGKTIDDRRGFVVRAAYDAERLYVAFEVDAPHGLVNGITDARILFRGGNCLDIQLAADPGADPKRKRPAPGDVRILVTRRGGKPLAVIYRPKVRGFQGKPIVLTSPTGKEAFHAIETADTVKLDYRPRPAGGGFDALVTIPLALLGWKPQPGASLKMDLGVVFGNKTGTAAAVRAYWHNNSFTANVINDIPHESRLEPHQWGTAQVE